MSKNVYKREWVNCPICDGSGTRKEWYSADDGPYIFCVNLACRSNGGDYEVKPFIKQTKQPFNRLRRPKSLRKETLERMKAYPGLRKKWSDQWVFIWSAEHNAFWRSNCCGYTTNQSDAGIYLFSKAYENTSHCDFSKRIEFVLV